MTTTVLFVTAASTFIYILNGKSNNDLLIRNIEALADGETSGACSYCYNGGPGSTACSVSAGVDIGIGVTAGCSVNCISGYYSCCSLRCVCCR